MKNYRLLIPLIFIGFATSGLLAQNLNVFPLVGRSGVGPVNAGDPQDLFHIHGWLCVQEPPGTFPPPNYFNPALRISLEENPVNDPTRIFGQLAMQNIDDNTGSPGNPPGWSAVATAHYSSLAKKYDFVLTTTETINPNYVDFNNQTMQNENLKSYTYDLILSTKNPFASIRFATTPQNAPLGIIADLERMIILNNGFVGIGDKNSNFTTNFPAQVSLPIKSPLQVGNISIQPTDFRPNGTSGSIAYNNWWDPTAGIAGQPKRLENGPVNGIGFEPWHNGTQMNPMNDGSNHGVSADGSVSLFAIPNGHGMQTYLAGAGLNLKPGSDLTNSNNPPGNDNPPIPGKLFLNMWNSSNGSTSNSWIELFDYQFPTWNTAKTDLNSDGRLFIRDKVFIGTSNFTDNHPPFSPTGFYELSVNGSILAKEIVVDAHASWADFVFNTEYELQPLDEVEKYVKCNHHLQDIPSAKEVSEHGQNIGKIQTKLLQKMEELTLYIISLKKENDQLKYRLLSLEKAK